MTTPITDAPTNKYKVGDVIRLPFADRFRVWMITGIHLGAVVEEDIVSLQVLDLKDGSAYGKRVAELMVPFALLHTHGRLQGVDSQPAQSPPELGTAPGSPRESHQCGSKSPLGILTCDQPRGHDGECSEGAVNQWKPLPAPCNPVESDSMSAQAFMNATVARMERYADNAETNGRSEEARIWRCAADTVQAQFLRMTQPLT